MADTDLIYNRPPVPTPGPVHLVFNEDLVLVAQAALAATLPGLTATLRGARPNDAALSATLPAITAALSGEPLILVVYTAALASTLPGLSATLHAGRPNDAALAASLPGLTVAAIGVYDLAVERPVAPGVRHTHQMAQPATTGAQDRARRALALRPGVDSAFTPADALRAGTQTAHATGVPLRSGQAPRHTGADPLRSAWRTRHADTQRHARPSLTARHTEADPLRTSAASTHQERYRDRRPRVSTRHTLADRLLRGVAQRSRTGLPLALRRQTHHQEAMRPPAGRHAPPVRPPVEPCYLPNAALLFSGAAALGTHLLFVCERHAPPAPGATLVIPIREIYMLTNNLTLTRVADGQPVPAVSASVSLDADSWTWGFQARLPGAAMALVDAGGGDPVELLLEVNGMQVRVLAESLRRDRSFGRADLVVRGRGRNAVLAEPFAPARTFENSVAATAQQLALDALTLNGVPTGWALDWGLEDWLVPAGAWLRHGTPVDALRAIAEAAGGYLQPHATAKTLRLLPRYAALPRDWSGLTPDVQLPADVVNVEGIEWLARPDYNRVFVAGGQVGGLLGQVTLAGTAGDLPAPTVVDPLATDLALLRQRGRAILGDTGRQARVSLRVPALPELGLVAPGKLLRYVDGATTRLGLVRSVQLDASHAQAWQTLGVETHV